MAMLMLCQHWAQVSRRALIVFTVDHGLRPEAASEAAIVAETCRTLGLPHQTLLWTDPKPTQAAARAARYGLLAQGAKAAGGACLLTGHTFDDVIETALIRRRRGVRGPMQAGPALAAPLPSWPDGRGIAVLRPLLRMTRTKLQATLQNENVNWVDDPSNDNLSYERVRIRQFLARQTGLALIASREAKKLRIARALADAALGEALANVHVHEDALIEISAADMSPRLASLLARCASGTDRDPRGAATRDMVGRLSKSGLRETLGGAWFQRTRSGFLIGRDPASIDCGADPSVFDGRFVRAATAQIPAEADAGFLVRHALPPGAEWREIVSERVAHMRLCFQTPFYDCVAE